MKKSVVINRSVIKGADEIVKKCLRKGKVVGKVRRSRLLEQAVLAVEHEIVKDPEGFARYIVSRMAWDMLENKSACEIWMA